MKIKYIKLKNFRSYEDEIKIDFKDLTVLVGKNDIGKSTILEALDIFFNAGSGAVKLDKSDINVNSLKNGDDEVIISVCFSELPGSIIIDSSFQTTLEDEYMLNAEGCLEVVKKYKNAAKEKVYIRANHPTNDACNDLLSKKISELKKIIMDNEIDCGNKTINTDMRRAIWRHYKDELNLQEVELDVSKEDAKKIWDKLSSYLPVYSLFQSDRNNSDGDSEVQDPLKEAVKQILNDIEIQKSLSEIATVVEAKLEEVSRRTLEKLNEMAPDVASSLNPVIPKSDKLKWADVFKTVSISGDEDIPINKRGSGVRRLVLLNFFRAEAERRLEEKDSSGIIYAIEEPETSQHTDNQRMLVKALKNLSNMANTQVILTTHSSTIVKELDFCDILLISLENNRKSVISVEPSVLKYPSLNEVNYVAYDEVTEEYHNELYGELEFHEWIHEYTSGRTKRKYVHINKGVIKEKDYDITEYIRHQIHHPENKHNVRFQHEELRKSIQDMRAFIVNKLKNEN